MKILDQRPEGALQPDAVRKALLRWAAVEREAWLDAVMIRCCQPESSRPITRDNDRGGGEWKYFVTPAISWAPSTAHET